ncbi:Uncharacterised protein [Mycobacteroides abscessus]|nr:Uncharacterised protein [Mycobacteroides abscessus]
MPCCTAFVRISLVRSIATRRTAGDTSQLSSTSSTHRRAGPIAADVCSTGRVSTEGRPGAGARETVCRTRRARTATSSRWSATRRRTSASGTADVAVPACSPRTDRRPARRSANDVPRRSTRPSG